VFTGAGLTGVIFRLSATRAGQGLAGLRPVRMKVVARLRSWPLNAAAV
jgi:hypothetical protein